MSTLRAGACVCVMTIALSARSARAQSSNAGLSESLFQQGKQLSAAGKYAEACPKFAESYKLDPASGTLLNLGACEESLGKTATAWAHFNDALALARRDQVASRVQFAQEHIKSLEARLIRLQINVPASSSVTGLEVKLDGEALNSAAFGVPNPIDPGHHTIDVSAPGKNSAQLAIEAVTPNTTLQAKVPTLEDAPVAVVAPVVVSPPAASAVTATPAPAASQSAAAAPPVPATASANPLRVVGYVVGGVGVIGLGVGTLFHFEASKENNLALGLCTGGASGTQCESQEDFSNHNSHVNTARSNRTVSYASLGIGAAALVTGVVLVVAGHSSEQAPSSAFMPVLEHDRLGCNFSGVF